MRVSGVAAAVLVTASPMCRLSCPIATGRDCVAGRPERCKALTLGFCRGAWPIRRGIRRRLGLAARAAALGAVAPSRRTGPARSAPAGLREAVVPRELDHYRVSWRANAEAAKAVAFQKWLKAGILEDGDVTVLGHNPHRPPSNCSGCSQQCRQRPGAGVHLDHPRTT
jgi:hypothetical protein